MGSRQRQPNSEPARRPRRSPSDVVRRALNSRQLPQLISALGGSVRASALQRHALFSAIEDITYRERMHDPAMRELLHHTCEMHLQEWRAITQALVADQQKRRGANSPDLSVFPHYARSLLEAGDPVQALAVVEKGANSGLATELLAELDGLRAQITEALKRKV